MFQTYFFYFSNDSEKNEKDEKGKELFTLKNLLTLL